MSLLLLPLLLPSATATPPGEVALRPWPARFPGLERIRTAVNHLSPGNWSQTKDGKVGYFNRALGKTTASKEVADVGGKIGRHTDAMNVYGALPSANSTPRLARRENNSATFLDELLQSEPM